MIILPDYRSRLLETEMVHAAIKRLSENDVGETNSHQAGFLIPKEFVRNGLFPELSNETQNPRLRLRLIDLTDNSELFASYIFYNNRYFGGTRLEYRLTGLTGWMKKRGLRSGDALQINRKSEFEYTVEVLKGERKPSTLSAESWIALYGEVKEDG
jgi:hypothetical protein